MKITIENKNVGVNSPCFIIAEIGTNHNRDLNLTKEMIHAAAETGADAIKFQTYHWHDIVHPGITADQYGYPSKKPWYQIIEERLSLPREWYPEVFAEARKRGVIPFSTPHCRECAEFLIDFNVPMFKVASMELTNLPFLRELAAFGKPVIISLGMGDFSEIVKAIQTLECNGTIDIILTHCVSLYPPQPDELNLRSISALKEAFGLPVGFSDHSPGTITAVAAVALGACLIEKHFTMNKSFEGPDHAFALEPVQFKRMVEEIREVEAALGTGRMGFLSAEQEKRKLYRKSLIAARDIPSGNTIKREDILVTRPESGISPEFLDIVIGMKPEININRYEPITWEKLKGA